MRACVCVCACVPMRVCVHACMSVFMHASNTLHSLAYVHTVCVCVCLSTHISACEYRVCARVCVCLCTVSSLCVWVGAYSCVYKCPLRPNTAKLPLETGQYSKQSTKKNNCQYLRFSAQSHDPSVLFRTENHIFTPVTSSIRCSVIKGV